MLNTDKIHEELALFLNDSRVKHLVRKAEDEVLGQLKSGAEFFSVSITQDELQELIFPKFGKLIRVYGSKPGVKGRVERHPNSFQSLNTIRGRGKTKTFTPDSGFIERIFNNQYWSFVPENVWHQPIAGNDNWVALTFHSAPAEKLIDEYRAT